MGLKYQKLDKKNCKCPNDTEFPRTVGRWAQLIILDDDFMISRRLIDDDLFEVNNKSEAFQQLMTNYNFLLRYTGRRWYGQIIDPSLSGVSHSKRKVTMPGGQFDSEYQRDYFQSQSS